jgi:hypothetical protein
MSEQPEDAGQDEAPAVVVQAQAATAAGTAPEPENNPEDGEG